MFDPFTRRNQRRHLWIPARPTPNGRIHLGHIAGPYLKTDVGKRIQERQGDHATVFGCVDAHDSYVQLKACRQGWTVPDTVAYYHQKIRQDFAALDIQFDVFINPLEADWAESISMMTRHTVESLIRRNVTVVRKESFLYSQLNQRWLLGCRLLGQCPVCGSDAGSTSCEVCGAHFRPEQLHAPRPRLEEGPLEWRTASCLYLRLSDSRRLLRRLEEAGVTREFRDILCHYFDREGPEIRLTQPGEWGIQWHYETGAPQIIYTSFSYMTFALFFGELYGRMMGSGVSAFSPESNVNTIGAFGKDNVLPFLVGGYGATLELEPEIRPFRHFMLNHFYELEGAKFSTSRGHAIWAGDIAAISAGSSDAVRCFLASCSPETEPTGFYVEKFFRFVNDFLVGELEAAVQRAVSRLNAVQPNSMDVDAAKCLTTLLRQQSADGNWSAFRLQHSVSALDTWISEAPALSRNASAAYWWLKGLALLAYPLMPRFSTMMWEGMGYKDSPLCSNFFDLTVPRSSKIMNYFTRMQYSDIAYCLPRTISLRSGQDSVVRISPEMI